jgi:isoquinoline 1-oxidoreductase subunit beta
MHKSETALNRRQLLKIGMVVGTGLVVSVQLPGCKANAKAVAPSPMHASDTFSPNAWVTIRPDDTITVMVNQSEMGQGIATALPMIVVEELAADWSKVKFEIAPVADV